LLKSKAEVYFWIVFFFSLLSFAWCVSNIKKEETFLSTEWTKTYYLSYLLQTNFSTKKKLTLDQVKNYLGNLGVKPDVIRRVETGIEIRFTDSWERVGELLNWLYQKGVKVKFFQADVISQKGIFKVKLIIK